jgi:hypothetical protein
VQRVTFILECGLREGVLRLQDIADGIGFKRIATCLPQSELQRVVEHALSRAREGQRLTEEQLLEAVPLHSLMRHIPLEHTWNEVVIGRLARPLQLVPARPGELAPVRRRTAPPLPPSRSRPSAPAPGFDPSVLPESLLELQRGLQRSHGDQRPPTSEVSHDELMAMSSDDSEETQMNVDVETRVDVDVEVETRVDVKAHREEEDRHSAEAESELARVTVALRELGRLPDERPDLSLPILLSIESMYAELNEASDPMSQTSVVRDAFPNDTHLRVALTSLIRLLDPELRTSDAALQQAESETLISAFLYEEQRLRSAVRPGSSRPPPSR